MRLGIDASNIRAGGGLTHLVEILRAARPETRGIERVVVWAASATLARLPERSWLECQDQTLLDGAYPYRLAWQQFRLTKLASETCDLLYVPGGVYSGGFRPFVTFSQNLLPFDWPEMRRYAFSRVFFRLALLRLAQAQTFSRADGLIFLTDYARRAVERLVTTLPKKRAVIPHGLGAQFRLPPRSQKPLSEFSRERPFTLLYVSIVDMYKHQWRVAEAVGQLRQSGLPVALEIVGPAYGPALRRLQAVVRQIDPRGAFIHYRNSVPHAELPACYHRADAFVFASTCETFGQTLAEAMAAGLPIACSNKSAMPEILGDGGIYFDPEDVDDMADALGKLAADPDLRQRVAASAYRRAQQYSWERCAEETFSFLAEVQA